MAPTRWDRIADIFDRAADLPPEARTAFLDREARTPEGAPDLALREEVEQLLAADASDAFLSGGIVPTASPLAPPPEAGPWRLTERVGQGGMGEVWRAERDASGPGGFEQTAAVKLVRPGLGESVAARFRAERQTLARLEHPAIARLLDGGTASDGRPYLATEFVRGEPITAYADRQRLGVNARLALFQEVCGAVAYAHSRLVVHRDLKPSNVLVASGGESSEFRVPSSGLSASGARGALEDEAGTPHPSSSRVPHPSSPHVKLLDFGIAKLLDADETLTRTGRPLLTPAYAAPEQASGGAITTATDVYGLGVLLYELLTGTRPTSGGDVTKPSDAVTTAQPTGGRVPLAPEAARSPEAAGGTGALRSTTPERLRKRLRGDLDRIVLKALRADPERRYRGAAEFGADIERHLAGLPVEARPESTAYRVGKFVRRNRVLVAVASIALFAIVGGAGGAFWQAQKAQEERDRADDRADEAEAVREFLVGMIGEAKPRGADADTLSVRDVLDIGAAQVDTGFTDRPLVRAALAEAIGESYDEISRIEEALSLYLLALRLRREVLGPDDRLVYRVENLAGTALLNQRKLDVLDSMFTAALARRRQTLGPTHPVTYTALNKLAVSANRRRRTDSLAESRAGSLLREGVDLLESVDRETFVAQSLEFYPDDIGKTPEEIYNEYLSGAYYSLGAFYLETDQLEEAVEPLRRSIDLEDPTFETVSGQISGQGYAILLRNLERYDESLAIHARVRKASLSLNGPEHSFYAHPLLAEGVTLWESGAPERAVPLVEQAVRIFGDDDDDYGSLEARHYLGRILVDAGEAERGRRVLREALPGLVGFFGEDDVRVRVARRLLRDAA